MGELTTSLMQAKKYDALKQAMHFWTNACVKEIEMINKGQEAKIITNCYPSLIDIVFGCMEFTELDLEDGADIEDTADDEKYTVIVAAGSLLQAMSQIIKNAIW